MNNGTNWRILVVEDKELFRTQLLEAIPGFVDAPDTAEADVCANFSEAVQRLQNDRYDLVILDLKDDSDGWTLTDDEPAGLRVFEHLKKTKFVPVIFYTALAHKVRSLETSFIRVVEKTETTARVKEEVQRVLATRLPALTRQVDEFQRSYMWDFVSTHWKDFTNAHEQVDLAYLLARRLALSLEKEARKLGRKMSGQSVPMADPKNIHPMEMFIPPPVGPDRQAGDILQGKVGDTDSYWITLTPSCDFEQAGRLHNVLIAQCIPLVGEPEYKNWVKDPKTNAAPLKALISDNREEVQSERFKFLPGTFFFPDSIVDFQRLWAVPPSELAKLKVIASLDSPFAEAVLARFSRYFGRLGTPDIDKTVFLNRLEATLPRPKVEGTPPASVITATAGTPTAPTKDEVAIAPAPKEVPPKNPVVIPDGQESPTTPSATPNAQEKPPAKSTREIK